MSKAPVRLLPAFKDYLWGGTRLVKEYNKKTDLSPVAESWELSTHKNGESIIADGEYKGLPLSEYLEKNKSALGKRAESFDFFPILIKLIDAEGDLSVQVHPDDNYAKRVEGEYGKTEMWYIVDCKENASLYYGVNREISKEEFRERIENNTVSEVLNAVPVHKGDVFFIPSGMIHAIGAGIVICEIQQNSNTTYRIYDYDRRDKDGNKRELHIDKALDVATLKPVKMNEKSQSNQLVSCKYFTVHKYEVQGSEKIETDIGSFKTVTVVDGDCSIIMNETKINLIKGDTVFIPAQDGEFTVMGNCTVITAMV